MLFVVTPKPPIGQFTVFAGDFVNGKYKTFSNQILSYCLTSYYARKGAQVGIRLQAKLRDSNNSWVISNDCSDKCPR